MEISDRTIMAALLGVFLVSGVAFLPVNSEASEPSEAGTLDYNETTHLVFMREEEKLARDVYITLGSMYPEARVFQNIQDSEEEHTGSVQEILTKYGLEDPNTDDELGVYTGEEWGEYFTKKYIELVEMGSKDLLSALYVGALIEELDMHDIVYCPVEIVETVNTIDDATECGQVYTDEKAIQTLYQNLLNGSANHLIAFVKSIENIIGEGKYEAQYLSQDEVNVILDR
jgi:hypothetical protein